MLISFGRRRYADDPSSGRVSRKSRYLGIIPHTRCTLHLYLLCNNGPLHSWPAHDRYKVVLRPASMAASSADPLPAANERNVRRLVAF